MNDLHLIQNLTQDLQAVKPQKPFLARWMILLLICAGSCAVGVLYWYIKKSEIHMPTYRSALELLALLATFGATTYLATRSVSPMTAEPQRSRAPSFSFLIWVFIVLGAFIHLYISDSNEALVALDYNTWLCPLIILSIAVPTAFLTLVYLARGAVLYAHSTFFYWALMALSTGAIGLSFICPWADPLHELLWHVLPVVIATMALYKAQSIFFAWKTRRPFLK